MTMDPVRLLITVTCLALASCGDKDGDDTGDGDTGPGFHPNVPEGYEWQWDTDGCDFDGDGEDDDGANVYQIAVGSSSNGHLSVTEKWYWFFGGDWEDDCIDTIEFSGSESSITGFESPPCSECEEEWTGTQEVTESQCNIGYDFLFGFSLDNSFTITYFFETLTQAGNPNEDNKMLITMVSYPTSTTYDMDADYAMGHVFPNEEGDYGGPSAYDWYKAGRCIGWGR